MPASIEYKTGNQKNQGIDKEIENDQENLKNQRIL